MKFTVISHAFIFLVFCFIEVTWCKCPPDLSTTVNEYVFVEESNYDRNFSAITTTGTRPLGYMKGTWYYNQDMSNTCIKISGAYKRKIEIMVETIPAAVLCVSLNGEKVKCSDPGIGRLFLCASGTEMSDYVEFVGNSAGEADVQFWYRFTLGPSADVDKEDSWCGERNTEEFPTSLKVLPSNYPLNTESDKNSNLSQRNSYRAISFVLTVILLYKFS